MLRGVVSYTKISDIQMWQIGREKNQITSRLCKQGIIHYHKHVVATNIVDKTEH